MNIIRCAIYDRVSTETQVKEGLSLDAQRQALTDYAISNGYEIVGFYADEGITARKKMQNRKELLRLLEDVKAGKIDLILVTKLDRWFRNIKDYHNTQSILEAHHCNWKTIFEEYDTSTSNGRFAINIMLSVNENECDRDADRIKEVQHYKISLGEVTTPSIINYGYRLENKHLVMDEEKSPIVKEIYKTFLHNHSKHSTYLNCIEKYGNIFTYQTFTHFFKSEIYIGKYKFNDNFCPAYLTKSEWEEIQEVNSRNIRICEGKTKKGCYLFTGLIHCPICGRNLSGGFVTNKKTYKYYNCWVHKVNRSCKFKGTISEKKLETNLKILFLKELGGGTSRLKARSETDSNPVFNIKKYDKELDRLNNIYLKGRISEEKYDCEYARIQQIINDNSCKPHSPITDLAQIEKILNGSQLDLYEALNEENRRSFWHNIINYIELEENKNIRSVSLR